MPADGVRDIAKVAPSDDSLAEVCATAGRQSKHELVADIEAIPAELGLPETILADNG